MEKKRIRLSSLCKQEMNKLKGGDVGGASCTCPNMDCSCPCSEIGIFGTNSNAWNKMVSYSNSTAQGGGTLPGTIK